MSRENSTVPMPHSISLTEREKMSISGVLDVSGFDDSIVILSTSRGELTVRGEGLHIDRIDLETGQLEVQGRVQELHYDESAPSRSVWARLFG